MNYPHFINENPEAPDPKYLPQVTKLGRFKTGNEAQAAPTLRSQEFRPGGNHLENCALDPSSQ